MSSPEEMEDVPDDAPSTSNMRHPRACRQCAVTKIKCTFRPGSGNDDPCDRCRRLKKNCEPQQPAPGPRKRRAKETRVAQLEKKIDGLFNLLNQRRESGDHIQVATPATSISGASTTRERDSRETQLPEPDSSSINVMMPVDASVETLYNHFLAQMVPHFPFVYHPHDKSAGETKHVNPFLFKEMVALASWKNLNDQREVQKRLVAEMVHRLMLKGEKTLDLLQSILVLCAWYQPFVFCIPQLTNLLHLGFALSVELGLNRAPQSRERRGVDSFTRRMAHGESANRTQDSPDHMRALLGCFYLHSVMSKSFRAMDGPKYTTYMDDCCRKLLETKDSPYDTRLVHLVRLQQFCEQIGSNNASDLDNGGTGRAPLGFYIASMANRLQEIKKALQDSTLTPELNEFSVPYAAQVAAGVAEIHLYEYAYYSSLKTHDHETRDSIAASSDYLYKCLQAISQTMEIHCKIAPAQFYDLPMTHWAYLVEMLIVMSKLFRADGNKSSKSHMYQVIDPSQIMDELINRFNRAPKEAGLTENDLFLYIARRITMFKSWIEDRPFPFAAPASNSTSSAATPFMQSNKTPEAATMDWSFMDDMGTMNGGLFADVDDTFWQSYVDNATQQPQPQPQHHYRNSWNPSQTFTQNGAI